jgi:hypothetical protein
MLDDNFYGQFTQQLTDDQKQKIAENIYSELEDRVGEQLASEISDQQYDEFQKIADQGNDLDLEQWLKTNAPGYEKLVEDTLEQLKKEAIATTDKFLAS